MVLLQAIRERVDVPLIAAGGICDGRGMAAAFALGAEGIQMGTRFVSSLESPVHQNYKQAIVSAEAIYDAGLMPVDALKGIRQVYFDGDMEAAPALAGQSAGLIHEVKSAQQIIDDTVAEFFAITERLGALSRARNFG